MPDLENYPVVGTLDPAPESAPDLSAFPVVGTLDAPRDEPQDLDAKYPVVGHAPDADSTQVGSSAWAVSQEQEARAAKSIQDRAERQRLAAFPERKAPEPFTLNEINPEAVKDAPAEVQAWTANEKKFRDIFWEDRYRHWQLEKARSDALSDPYGGGASTQFSKEYDPEQFNQDYNAWRQRTAESGYIPKGADYSAWREGHIAQREKNLTERAELKNDRKRIEYNLHQGDVQNANVAVDEVAGYALKTLSLGGRTFDPDAPSEAKTLVRSLMGGLTSGLAHLSRVLPGDIVSRESVANFDEALASRQNESALGEHVQGAVSGLAGMAPALATGPGATYVMALDAQRRALDESDAAGITGSTRQIYALTQGVIAAYTPKILGSVFHAGEQAEVKNLQQAVLAFYKQAMKETPTLLAQDAAGRLSSYFAGVNPDQKLDMKTAEEMVSGALANAFVFGSIGTIKHGLENPRSMLPSMPRFAAAEPSPEVKTSWSRREFLKENPEYKGRSLPPEEERTKIMQEKVHKEGQAYKDSISTPKEQTANAVEDAERQRAREALEGYANPLRGHDTTELPMGQDLVDHAIKEAGPDGHVLRLEVQGLDAMNGELGGSAANAHLNAIGQIARQVMAQEGVPRDGWQVIHEDGGAFAIVADNTVPSHAMEIAGEAFQKRVREYATEHGLDALTSTKPGEKPHGLGAAFGISSTGAPKESFTKLEAAKKENANYQNMAYDNARMAGREPQKRAMPEQVSHLSLIHI
jgi:hypothetical protein